MTSRAFAFDDLTARERYKLLIGTVIPRPIALVTTRSAAGRANAGAFSFFNVLTHDPAILAIGIENRPDGTPKDTGRNILETGEFTVHIADFALVDQMEICSIKFEPEVDELELAGLETVPGRDVRSPRIVAAPAAFECTLLQSLPVGSARIIVLGQVRTLFLRNELLDPETLRIDQVEFDAIGRLGGHLYSRQLDQFEKVTPTPQAYFERVEQVSRKSFQKSSA